MLNDNRIVDYRNLSSFSFSFLHYRFSKCVHVNTALAAAESPELIIIAHTAC